MKIELKSSAVVKPLPAKPRTTMWISNLDTMFPEYEHVRNLLFYRPSGAAGFFDAAVLKAALARTLSEFYPLAGRLKRDETGRIAIDCNGEGVVYTEAEADGAIDDLGDFVPRLDIPLGPIVDYSQGISSVPLFLVQVTRFKCGGVCLGIAEDHVSKDGLASLHMLTTWADIARGLDMAVPPYMDRRVLAARNPPQPKFDHVEFQPPPPLKIREAHSKLSERKCRVLEVTREQLSILKAKCQEQEDEGNKPPCSSFEVLAGHAWKCICKARQLPKDQETKVTIIVDGRSRLQPPLPSSYFGNAVSKASHIALSGEIESDPLNSVARKIRKAIARQDDEYLRSAIDYLEVQGGLHPNARSTILNYENPNIGITNCVQLPFYEADFGWGRPFYVGVGAVLPDGLLLVMSTPMNDGMRLTIALPEEQMKLFEKLFYDIGPHPRLSKKIKSSI